MFVSQLRCESMLGGPQWSALGPLAAANAQQAAGLAAPPVGWPTPNCTAAGHPVEAHVKRGEARALVTAVCCAPEGSQTVPLLAVGNEACSRDACCKSNTRGPVVQARREQRRPAPAGAAQDGCPFA